MYSIIKNVINRGEYDLSTILTKTNTLWAEGKLTDEQRAELLSLARNGAKPSDSVDIYAKLSELEQRIRALEANCTTVNTVSEYVKGKYYYSGDKVAFEGATYICTAPAGVVCVWSPEEYPSYWEVIGDVDTYTEN